MDKIIKKSGMLDSEKYGESLKKIAKPILMLVAALLIVMAFLAISGYDPSAMLIGLERAVTTDFAGSIRWAIPMLLSGIAVCIPFKAQVFNLGVDGQIYMGAVASTAVALALPENSGFWGLIIVFSAGMVAGMFYAMIAAAMKVYCNTDMVVSTLLLNFVAQLFTEFMAAGVLRDSQAVVQMNASKVLPTSLWLPRLSYLGPSNANVGIYIAIIVCLLAAFLFYKTTLGYEIKIVGTNEEFARYGGMKPKGTILKVMAISGAVAGLIGVIEVTAVQHRLMAGFNPGFGFSGIVVALLANNNPLGVLLSGSFFGILTNGGSNMERVTEVPSIITQVTMAIIILAVSSNVIIKKINWKKRGAKNGTTV